MTTRVTFYGAVGEVTGAHTLVDTGKTRFAIDCGMFQGEGSGHEQHEKNAAPFPEDPFTIQHLFITHAHADHVGRIAKFVKDGFQGTIYSSPETKALAALIMMDAVHIMKMKQIERSETPIYDEHNVAQALAQWETYDFHTPIRFGAHEDGITATYIPIAHILGAGGVRFVRVVGGKERVLFCTGDVGNSPDALLPPPEQTVGAHYLITESVYGDRLHEGMQERNEKLRKEIIAADARGGTLVIPSFAVHRTQSLLYEINKLFEDGRAPIVPVYLDSPLGSKATEVYRRATHLYSDEVKTRIKAGDDIFAFPKLTFVANARDSQKIEEQPGAKVIIAGSGMSVGGRVLLHEASLLGDPHATILFVGYQAPGTLGRHIQQGDKRVRIGKEWVAVKARVQTISGYSGHADRDQLLAYAGASKDTLERVFCIMGEVHAASFLAQRITGELGVDALVPHVGQVAEIEW